MATSRDNSRKNRRLPAFMLALAACLLAPTVLLAAGIAELPGVDRAAIASPVQTELLRDLTDGRLDSRSLVAAALVAEGIEEPHELARLLEKWEARRTVIVALARKESTPTLQAQVALERLYADVLTGHYDAPCSETRRALDEGVYNCVTATILYLDLCGMLDLPGEPLGRPGHVCCRVRLGGEATNEEWQAVETTCAAWFAHLRAGRIPESTHHGHGELVPLTHVQLLAKVYYNRAGALLTRSEFAAALPWIDLAWRLDPTDRRAKENLLAALNNGALLLSKRGDHSSALAWIAVARQIDPTFAPIEANERFIRSAAGR